MNDNDGLILEIYNPDKTYTGQKKFDCENKVINRFVSGSLKKQVRQNLSQCFVLLDTIDNDRFIGFYTLSSFAIEAHLLEAMSEGSLPSRIPVSRLVMLAVDKAYKGRGLGKRLVRDSIIKTVQASDKIDIYGMYLDADEKAYTFYIDCGFLPLKDKQDQLPTPMFIHIETLRLAVGL